METALIVVLFIIAFIACLAITIAIPAWVIMLVLGALHTSGLENIPAISFTQAFLLVSLVVVVFLLLYAAARDC